MITFDNSEEVSRILDRFNAHKSTEIPPELCEYIDHVAKTGDTVYRWSTIRYLFREKIKTVIKEFQDTTTSIEDLPRCPNVDDFNFDGMMKTLFERFDNFQTAPFTIQRLCELLSDPKKHYNRLDKFMRALEKNILVGNVETHASPVDIERDDDEHIETAAEVNIDEAIEKLNAASSAQVTDAIVNGKPDDKSDADKKEIDEKIAKTADGEKTEDKMEDEKIDEKMEEEKIDEKIEAEKIEENPAAEPDSVAENGTNTDAEKAAEKAVEKAAEIAPDANEADASEVEKPEAVPEKKADDAKPIVDSSSDVVKNCDKNDVEPSEAIETATVDSTQEAEVAPIESTNGEDDKNSTATANASNEDVAKSADEDTATPSAAETSTAATAETTKTVAEDVVSSDEIGIDKPPTPKRSREDDDDDEVLDDDEHSAKKIKPDSAEDETDKNEAEAKPIETEAEKIVEDSDLATEEKALAEEPMKEADAPVAKDVSDEIVDTPMESVEEVQPTEAPSTCDAAESKAPAEDISIDAENVSESEPKPDVIPVEIDAGKTVDEIAAVTAESADNVDMAEAAVQPAAME